MKNILFLLITVFALSFSLSAQNSIYLKINHLLGEEVFEFNTDAMNNYDEVFQVTRVEYYLSNFSIIHDGGTETEITHSYFLLDGNKGSTTVLDLGEHNITDLEAIRFYTGVDPIANHADPSLQPATSPLAPKSPSMHWGWAQGYRFVAFEGFGGSNMDKKFELHGLGDDNYHQIEIQLDNQTNENNSITVSIDADYTKIVENIHVNDGVISHGKFYEAKQSVENFRDFVFAATPHNPSDVSLVNSINKFDIYPNPSTDGNFSFEVNTDEAKVYMVSISDLLGRTVQQFELNSNQLKQINCKQSGLFIAQLQLDGQTITSRKITVK